MENFELKTPDLRIDSETKMEILNTLKELGVPTHVKGYDYIKTAVRLVLECPGYLSQITKGLYPAVAIIYSTTSSRVERSIRHAIEVTFDRSTPDSLEKHFGPVDYNKGKMTNAEFLSRLAEDIRIKRGIYYGDDVKDGWIYD